MQRIADTHSSPVRSPAHKVKRRKDYPDDIDRHRPSRDGSICWRTIHCRDSRTRTRGCYATEAAMEIFVSAWGVTPTRQERNTIMEPLMAAAAEPINMLSVGRSGGCRLIAAMQRESTKIGRSQRASTASIRHAAAQSAAVDGVDARTQPSGGSATPGQAEEAGERGGLH